MEYNVKMKTIFKNTSPSEKNWKEWIGINHLQLSYTSEMEKAMLKAHGVGYEEYSRRLSVRIKVENRRKNDYRKCCRMTADFDRLAHYNNRLKS